MLQKFLHKLIRRRHPWRDMQFEELAEIYTSMSLRSFGFSVIGIFVPIYLYGNGVDLQGILLYFTIFFALRIPVSFVVGYIIGRIGPKHTIALSTVMVIVFLGMLLSYSSVGWPLFILAFVFNLSNNLFFIAYHADFSKIKDQQNGGKELGWLLIFERIGNALGPVVGGLLGSLWAPEATLVFAIGTLILSLIPLFLTNEQVKLHQKVSYKGFSPWKYRRDFVSISSFGVQNVSVTWLWPLLVAVFIFTEGTYAKVGAVIGVTMAVSIFSARMFGSLIDSKKGALLLKYGVAMSFIIDFAKAATTTASGAIVLSAVGEPIVLAYRMPLTKGLYDVADGGDNFRIVYLVWAEVIAGLFKTVFCGALLIAAFFYDPVSVLRASYIFAPFIGLIMLTQRFPALK